MKTRATAVLSLTGVLVTGAAAALVNAQVLQNGGSPTGSTAPVSVPGPTTVPFTTVTVPDGSTTVPPATLPANTQATYRVGEAGMVTLDTVGDALTIVAVTPNPGWTVAEIEQDDPYRLEVKFRAGTLEVEFHANFLLGVVGTSVETRDVGTPSTSAADDDDHTDDSVSSDDDEHDDDGDDEHDDD